MRFVDTGNFAAKSDDIIGLEAAGIFKSLHVAAEGQYLKSNAYDAGDSFAIDDPDDALDQFPGNAAPVRAGRQPQLLGRLYRGRLFPDRRNPRLQERHLGSHEGAEAVQQGWLGRVPGQWPRRLSRPRHEQAARGVQQQLRDGRLRRPRINYTAAASSSACWPA